MPNRADSGRRSACRASGSLVPQAQRILPKKLFPAAASQTTRFISHTRSPNDLKPLKFTREWLIKDLRVGDLAVG